MSIIMTDILEKLIVLVTLTCPVYCLVIRRRAAVRDDFM